MFIDSLAGVIPPQSLDVRLEKKEDREEPKPIKGSGKSNGAQLDMAKQTISKKHKGGEHLKTGNSSAGTYSVLGLHKKDISTEEEGLFENLSLDLCI